MADDNTRQVAAGCPNDDGDAVLRRLARRALGLSGADIARLVREARQVARRAGRTLAYDDLDSLLSSDRPTLSPERRHRIAVHESGHTLARILLNVGEVSAISIDGPGGLAFTESIFADDAIDTREGCETYLQTQLAGRAAEQIVYGGALSGSGGSERSDLAKATQLAVAMETSLGFGSTLNLVYRDPGDWQLLLRSDHSLALRVQAHLHRAEVRVRRLIRRHRNLLDLIAEQLVAHGTLEGEDLQALIRQVRDGGTNL